MKILVNHSELTLKGRNRPFFERKLKDNIHHTVGKCTIANLHGRFLIELANGTSDTVNRLSDVFGIANVSEIHEVPASVDLLEKRLLQSLSKTSSFSTFAVRTKKAYKKNPVSSRDMDIRIGDLIRKRLGKSVNLVHPDKIIYIEIHENTLWYYFKKIEGRHGLPVGTGGKVLCLLSGGIDSPVAGYLMGRRGSSVDFLHFHAFSNNTHAQSSKIAKTAHVLNHYTLYSSLTFAPYTPFQMQLLEARTQYELMLFRRFMLKVGERMAKKRGYQALVTGDNLGQVASQTLENIVVTHQAVNLPILTPLIGFNKNEIIQVARSIGTYELSIQGYKDCCSILDKHPKTKSTLQKVLADEDPIPISAIVEETLADAVTIKVA